MTLELSYESVVEDWIADRKLSNRKLNFLEQDHERTMQEIGLVTSFSIASSYLSDELDLPQGSYWVQVVADLLDYLAPSEEGSRLGALNKELIDYGHLA